MVLGPLCALLIWLMPIEGISESAHHMLAIMSLVAIWWITEPIPIPVTSLLGPTLCVVLDIAPMKDAFDNFANPMIFLFMGGFLLAKGMMVNGIVAMVLYFLIAYAVLWKMFPADVKHIDGAREFIKSNVNALGKWTTAQKSTIIAFSVAVVLWVAPSVLSIVYGAKSDVMTFYDNHFPESIAAMVGGLLLFFLPGDRKKGETALSWKDGVEGIEWGTLLLFGGGLAMGAMMYTTGLSAWIGNGIKEALGDDPSEWAFVGVFCVTALILSELTSHTASTNLIAPIAIGAALSLEMNPIPVAIGIALSSSLGFMMPVSTPPNAIVYASGYVPITKMIKTGFIIDLIGISLVTIPVVILLVKFVMNV